MNNGGGELGSLNTYILVVLLEVTHLVALPAHWIAVFVCILHTSAVVLTHVPGNRPYGCKAHTHLAAVNWGFRTLLWWRAHYRGECLVHSWDTGSNTMAFSLQSRYFGLLSHYWDLHVNFFIYYRLAVHVKIWKIKYRCSVFLNS